MKKSTKKDQYIEKMIKMSFLVILLISDQENMYQEVGKRLTKGLDMQTNISEVRDTSF